MNTSGANNSRRSNTVVVSRRFSLFSKEVENLDLRNIDDGSSTGIGTNTMGRPNRRRCSLFFEEQDKAAITDRVKICNSDLHMINDAFADDNVDIVGDALSPIKDPWRVADKKERNLSLALNFDMKSLFSSDEESRRASIAFAKFVTEELDTTNMTHSTKHERTLSLAMNFDMKSLFSSDEESRRASMAFAKLISEEIDTVKAAQTRQPCVDSGMENQLSHATSHATSSINSTSIFQNPFQNNLANYYLMIRGNLCDAMQRSQETRAAIGNLKAKVLSQVPQVNEPLKRTVIKRSQPSKYLSAGKQR